MRRSRSEDVDMAAVRSAVSGVIDRFDGWLLEAPEPVLIRVAAPLEMLQFQYYLTPPSDRHLLRAARVCCEAAGSGLDLDGCPQDMVRAFDVLAKLVLN